MNPLPRAPWLLPEVVRALVGALPSSPRPSRACDDV